MLLLAIVVMIITYGLIISRGITRIPPWVSMLFGGVLMIIFNVLTLQEAIDSINMEVILFLITLFIFASALEVSGFLKFLAYEIIKRYKEPKRIFFYILLYSGLLSNLVTNDGIAASWTPIILEMSNKLKIDELPFLYALAVGVTIGSVVMPTGNPQNLLITLESGIHNPFVTFVKYLLIPTIISIILAYVILFRFFKNSLSNKPSNVIDNIDDVDFDKKLGYSALILLIITVFLFLYILYVLDAYSIINKKKFLSFFPSSFIYF